MLCRYSSIADGLVVEEGGFKSRSLLHRVLE